jgi:hypothetical protein
MSDPTPTPLTDAASLIAAERQRQIDVEGYDQAHDRNHGAKALRRAGSSYAYGTLPGYGRSWPWAEEYWKPRDRLSNLVRAGALYVASLDVEHDDQTVQHLAAVANEIDAILATARQALASETAEAVAAVRADERERVTVDRLARALYETHGHDIVRYPWGKAGANEWHKAEYRRQATSILAALAQPADTEGAES